MRDEQITDINSLKAHRTLEVICVKCLYRYVAVALAETPLIKYECKDCGPGYVIATGQWINPDDPIPTEFMMP